VAGLAAVVAAVIAATAVSVSAVLSRSAEPALRAAIVDQLALTSPNPAFGETARDLLERDGYAVQYYPGEEVTVDFYRHLPAQGYDLIIFRVHAARRPDVLRSSLPDEAALFTSEPYSASTHVEDQDALRLVKVRYAEEDAQVYFGIRSDFITDSMEGNFGGATIVLMGCNGLTTSRTAEAFIEKGARAVIGWTDLVSAEHSDEATERLLEHLVVDKEDTADAVTKTMAEVGPDPAFHSILRVYLPQG
jgi:hypothetical protein